MEETLYKSFTKFYWLNIFLLLFNLDLLVIRTFKLLGRIGIIEHDNHLLNLDLGKLSSMNITIVHTK